MTADTSAGLLNPSWHEKCPSLSIMQMSFMVCPNLISHNRLALHLHQPCLTPLSPCRSGLLTSLTIRTVHRRLDMLQAHLEFANLIIIGHGVATISLKVAHQMRWMVATSGCDEACSLNRLFATGAKRATERDPGQRELPKKLGFLNSLVLMITITAARLGFPDVE